MLDKEYVTDAQAADSYAYYHLKQLIFSKMDEIKSLLNLSAVFFLERQWREWNSIVVRLDAIGAFGIKRFAAYTTAKR